MDVRDPSLMLREFFGKDDLEKKIESNERKVQELLQKIEEANHETTELFAELEVRPEQVKAVLSDSSQFSKESWNKVQSQMEELNKKISGQRQLNQVRRAYKEQAEIQRQWIFVR